jgi:hypothetical protein
MLGKESLRRIGRQLVHRQRRGGGSQTGEANYVFLTKMLPVADELPCVRRIKHYVMTTYGGVDVYVYFFRLLLPGGPGSRIYSPQEQGSPVMTVHPPQC